MLTSGCNHVALVTEDLERFVGFYTEVFDAQLRWDLDEGPVRHALLELGGGFGLHPFELTGGSAHARGSATMFERGHLDHLAIDVPDVDAFEEVRRRLVVCGASDGAVTDFGVTRNVWFEDPDGHGSEIALWADAPPRTFAERVVEAYAPTPEPLAVREGADHPRARCDGRLRDALVRSGRALARTPFLAFAAGLRPPCVRAGELSARRARRGR